MTTDSTFKETAVAPEIPAEWSKLRVAGPPLPMVGVQGSRVVLAGISYSLAEAEEFMSTARSMITIARRNLERSANGR